MIKDGYEEKVRNDIMTKRMRIIWIKVCKKGQKGDVKDGLMMNKWHEDQCMIW